MKRLLADKFLLLLLIVVAVFGLGAFYRVRHIRLNEALFTVISDTPRLESLLDQGADVDAREPRWNSTPLNTAAAAAAGNDPAVQVLLNHGANINAANNNGLTPLINAAMGGHPSTVQLLLSKGANPAIKHRLGRTALNEALSFQRVTAGKPQRLSKNRDYSKVVALLRQAQNLPVSARTP